jgi:glutamate dehydrogenase
LASEADLNKLIARTYPEPDSTRLTRFAALLLARETPERLEQVAADRWLATVRTAWEFFEVRTEPMKVRVDAAADGEGITVVHTATPDCPFIVDSLLEYFHGIGAGVRALMHPICRVARDREGRIVSFEQRAMGERGESLVRAELELGAGAADAGRIAREVREVLAEVQLATGDFDRMTARALEICEETAGRRELIEVRDFLRWLVQGGFVFLGYRRYLVTGAEGHGRFRADLDADLGIARRHDESRFRTAGSFDELLPARRKLFFEGPALVIGKARAPSLVHRRAPMDTVSIRRDTREGKVEAFDYFAGLFTSKAYAEEAQHIPLLRAKLKAVLEAEGAEPGSHDYKEIVSAFNSFPKDELFRAPLGELREQLRAVLDLKHESAVRLVILPDLHRGDVIALVIMPREAFSAEVRQRIQEALARGLGGALIYYHLALGEGYTARLHFCFAADAPRPQRIKELESEIVSLARRWEDRLHDQLLEKFGALRGRALAVRWSRAFGAEYKAAMRARRAVEDIERIEELIATGRESHVELRRRATPQANPSEIRMVGIGVAPMLSELMPMLQNFAIEVLAEDVHALRPEIDGRPAAAYVEAFSVQWRGGQPLFDAPGAGAIADAIAAVRSGLAEDDPLGALVLSAGLAWREVALLRAYLAAAFQMRLAPARPALRRVLLGHPELARALFDLFAARLDPACGADGARLAAMRAAYLERLGAIDNIADDRTARMLLSMVEATVRTNYFRESRAPDPYLALKFESSRILGLADTAPLYEIHVTSPRMEGCHLRAGKVARGGIRFSDRPDDFRTEIFGLMKTQTVKNAIIVPVGSKGGFIVKQRAPGETGVDAYRTLISAMLDLTDNLTDSGTAHPARVRVLDTDGPYLVVAADKGTASFSDVANEIAVERGFWLGDAFASGGRHGFDHKKLGITARGAWESARRHLREMGRDPARGTPITIIGIGDMSGDVFGNGLLQSSNLRLMAAFDHRHIFIDPSPEPAASFAERKRLFELAHSTWADYNPALISRGGGVWKRGQKRIELAAEARAALAIDSSALDGESLIAAILRAPADMLYNGGIGTYVRAGDETDAEVGDHANDACRIAASELRVKVVIEGGNLGFTQKARIEYALGGGRINTDAIDNSGGVDTSDHEVNLKILLEPEVARGALKFEQRNRLLADSADAIAESVLRDNRDQALSLSLEQLRSRTRVSTFRDHLQAIEERGLLRRHEEALPTREALAARHARYPGLTRPELALMTAYTKLDLVRRIEQMPLADDPYLIERFLVAYFPPAIAARFAAAIPRHRLRHELIATRLVNQLVDLMGSTFVFGTARDLIAEPAHVVRAWLIASDVLDIPARAERLKSGAPAIAADAEVEAVLALERACAAAAVWALQNFDAAVPIAATVARFKPAFEKLSERFEPALAAGERDRFELAYRELRAAVGEGDLAHGLARLSFAGHLLNVLSLAFARGIDPARAAEAYFALAAQFDFARLERALGAVGSEDRWERRAARELAGELRDARIALCCALLDGCKTGAAPTPFPEAFAQIRASRPAQFAEVEQLMAELQAVATPSLAALEVTVRALTRLASAR